VTKPQGKGTPALRVAFSEVPGGVAPSVEMRCGITPSVAPCQARLKNATQPMATYDMSSNPALGFFCRFVVIYVLLILPWPGLGELYSQYFRALGELAFSRDNDRRIILFEDHRLVHAFETLDTRMIMGNRDTIDSNGNGRTTTIDLDTRSIGWDPTALTIALILATPVPWRRRGWALLWGLLLIHGFILFTLQSWIWNASPGISLSTLSPFWKEVADNLQYTLITQMGVSFSVPVLIWILVTFRLEDARRLTVPHATTT